MPLRSQMKGHIQYGYDLPAGFYQGRDERWPVICIDAFLLQPEGEHGLLPRQTQEAIARRIFDAKVASETLQMMGIFWRSKQNIFVVRIDSGKRGNKELDVVADAIQLALHRQCVN